MTQVEKQKQEQMFANDEDDEDDNDDCDDDCDDCDMFVKEN